MDKKQFAEILMRLDNTNRLLVGLLVKDTKTQRGQIIRLASLGFRPVDIASLLNTTPNYVNVTLNDARKKGKLSGG